MRFSRTLWLWASLAVIALAIFLMRVVSPRHVRAPERTSIPDLSVTSPLNQPGGGTIDPGAYEIYSALYATPQPEALAFAEDSLTDVPQVDGSCLKPSTVQEREMTDTFVSANKQSHRWENRLTIPTKYRLLSRTETDSAQRCIQGHGKDTQACEPYKNLQHDRYLGVPGFDHTRTRALVSVVKKCGAYCGSGGIFVVEKAGNTWRRADANEFTRECSWMY